MECYTDRVLVCVRSFSLRHLLRFVVDSHFQLLSLNNSVKHMIVVTYIYFEVNLCKPILVLIELIKLVNVNTMLLGWLFKPFPR